MRYSLIILLLLFQINSGAQTYKKIHSEAILVDTHNDFLSKAVESHVVFDTNLNGITQSDLGRMFSGGVKVQVFSIFCDEHYGRGSAFAMANRELDSLYAIVGRNPKTMQIVYSYKELLRAVKEHKLACMSGVEGGHMIEDKMDNLDSFYKRGVRYMTLTWNNSTSWSTSAMDESQQAFKVTSYGLNDFGKQVVKKMNQLGMMVDVSHIGEKTFWDVMATTTRPVIASHSSVYALCPVFRNLKDDQIRAIAKNGGVIQVNFYSGFLDSTYVRKFDTFYKKHRHEYDSMYNLKLSALVVEDYFSKKYKTELEIMRPPLSLLIDHIDYIVKIVGVDYVGLGSDFDGIDSAPVGLDGVEDFPKITEALIKRGYSEKDIKKILGGNFLRVFKANDNYRGFQ
ncbi:MAG TPA: membrane dipeptidase [Chitinophagaceae bacterium]|jgi:membrane dipeptidase|nr:membrane dipeptidase [Chitinophagaceae bacterium]